jgi:hypothetical protein
MLDAAIAGEAYSKAELIRLYRGDNCDSAGPLAARSRGSIEFKLMNASAAHADIINDYVERYGEPASRDTMHSHGYRAMPNYQASLKETMAAEFSERDFRTATAGIFTDEASA